MRKILFATLFTFVSVSVHAETGKGSNTLAIFGGGGGTSSKFDLGSTGGRERVADGGGTWGGQWIYFFKDHPVVGFGVDGSSTRLDDHQTLDLVYGANSTSHLRSTVVMAVAKLAYPTGHVRPYIFGGLGGHHSSVYLAAQPYGGATWSDTGTTERRVLLDESKSSLAVGYGIGFDVFFTDEVFLGLEYRGIFLGHDRYDETSTALSAGLRLERSGLNTQALLLRAGVKFGT